VSDPTSSDMEEFSDDHGMPGSAGDMEEQIPLAFFSCWRFHIKGMEAFLLFKAAKPES